MRSRRKPSLPWVRLLAGALVLLVLINFRSGNPHLYPGQRSETKTEIFLIDNGLHTDLVLPREALLRAPHLTGRAMALTTRAPWIMIGFGDAKFYTEEGFSRARILDGFRAMFFPNNPSVVRIGGLTLSPDHAWTTGVYAIYLSHDGAEALLRRIDRALATDAAGAPIPSIPIRNDEAFFTNTEHFSLVHICNHWTAELLNAAGLPVNLFLATIPAALIADLKWQAHL